MCFLCWSEFSDDQNPAVDLGCGHFACSSCVSALRAENRACPVCHSVLRASVSAAEIDTPWWDQAGYVQTPRGGLKLKSALQQQHGDTYVDTSTEMLPSRTTSAAVPAFPTAPSPQLLHLSRNVHFQLQIQEVGEEDIEAGPSTSSSTSSRGMPSPTAIDSPAMPLPTRHHPHARNGSGRYAALLESVDVLALMPPRTHQTRGGGAGLPTIRQAATKELVAGAQQVANHVAKGSWLAALIIQRHFLRPMAAIGRFIALHGAIASRSGVAWVQSRALRAVRFAVFLSRRSVRASGLRHVHDLPPISNANNQWLVFKNSSDCCFRLEYCANTAITFTNLRDCDVMLVGCQALRLGFFNCTNLRLRELGSEDVGDMVRKDCTGFVHEVVCLRCACQPLQFSSFAAAAAANGPSSFLTSMSFPAPATTSSSLAFLPHASSSSFGGAAMAGHGGGYAQAVPAALPVMPLE